MILAHSPLRTPCGQRPTGKPPKRRSRSMKYSTQLLLKSSNWERLSPNRTPALSSPISLARYVITHRILLSIRIQCLPSSQMHNDKVFPSPFEASRTSLSRPARSRHMVSEMIHTTSLLDDSLCRRLVLAFWRHVVCLECCVRAARRRTLQAEIAGFQ